MFEFNSFWYKPDIFIKKLANALKIKPKHNFLETYIELRPEQGSGSIRGFEFRNGVSLLLFSMCVNSDWQINFSNDSTPPLQLTYVLEGNVTHTVNDFKESYRLKALENTIVSCPVLCKQSLSFSADKSVSFAILQIDKEDYFGPYYRQIQGAKSKVKDVFFDIYGDMFFFDQRQFNLETSSKLNQLFVNDTFEIANLILAEAITLEMIGQQIRYISDDKFSMTKMINLSPKDLEKINLAKTLLEREFKNAPTILELSKRVGINQQKLKVGFKKVYNITIKSFVIQLRMEKAAKLIAQGSTVKDAMEKVGYSNPGHFGKRFKEFFGVLPKDYRKKTGVVVSKGSN